ncbi:hypothetical protein EJ05DRAFT_475043 [Pseudovirgaria hyperparasitica]|uniref:RRM domain-containing protein n=1 Tax=Pseudovirgaria hyperparasitica TaxID=470096 RepID=A0A6A6WBS4_9PEZI|nr:uncharacterized protein EJ05DRAFT_475043 [Pseudovirgaria hyperparasitica]KAF2760025.1 hypothetical protein EJ05DRAFT_475043 [Pseudovirgaria hyperparasitica]
MASGSATPSGYQSQQSNYQTQSSYPQQFYQPQAPGSAYSAAPVIQNPFPLPGQDNANGSSRQPYDPELEAQIAQWQSAYVPRDDSAFARNGARNEVSQPGTSTPQTNADNSTNVHQGTNKVADGRPVTVVRHGAGKTWEDNSLLEWGDDPRLFVGNLAGEVTDDSLLKAFSKFNAAKARVIRDKRTTKSKGYGFVSFKNADDFFSAAKEMVGKYIGSHPVTIKKAEKIATPSVVRDQNSKHNHKNRKGNFREGHANTGAGVRKPQKPKGPKLLG